MRVRAPPGRTHSRGTRMLRIARVCTRRTSCDVIEAALAIDDHARRRRWAGGALAGPVARNGRRREPVRSGEGIGLGRVDVVMAGWCSVRGDRVCTHGAPALCARPFPRRRGCLRMHVEVPNTPAICSGTMGTLPVTRTSRASCVRRAVTRHAHGPRPTGGRGAAGGTGRIARPSPELQEVREPPAITPARRSPPSTTVTRSCTPPRMVRSRVARRAIRRAVAVEAGPTPMPTPPWNAARSVAPPLAGDGARMPHGRSA